MRRNNLQTQRFTKKGMFNPDTGLNPITGSNSLESIDRLSNNSNTDYLPTFIDKGLIFKNTGVRPFRERGVPVLK